MTFLKTVVIAVVVLMPTYTLAESGFQRWMDANRAENESMIEYAKRNHQRLLDEGATHSINPGYSDTMAEWRYYMPDGAVVSCLRGAEGYTFIYECSQH